MFTNLFLQPDWRNVFDVAIMTVIIYYIIKLLIHTRASAVFKGIAVVLVFAWVSDALQLNAPQLDAPADHQHGASGAGDHVPAGVAAGP